MRTLYEIIESAKDGNMPTHEECYWAMLCYNSMFALDHRALREALLVEKQPNEFVRKVRADNSHNMYVTALNKSPKDYLGLGNEPNSRKYQGFRKISNKILDTILNNIPPEKKVLPGD